MSADRIATVVVNLALDKVFDYQIPDSLRGRVRIGSRVEVPFGHGRQQAFVVALKAQASVPRVKPLLRLLGERPLIPESLLGLAEWLAEYYCCAKEQAVQALLPAVVRRGRMTHKKLRVVRLEPAADLAAAMAQLEARHCRAQVAVLKRLELQRELPLTDLARQAAAVRALCTAHLVTVTAEVAPRDPFGDALVLPDTPKTLTAEQQTALDQIVASFGKPRRDVVLLFGVTGSGKTEVYLQAIAQCLAQGQEAIVLVPEIALTPQTTQRFRARFGEQVSVLHSHLSDGERFDEWTKVHEGRVRIVVGARSAVFAPFCRLGLIVVDEEHETSYKQDGHPPRYHARDVAVMRGRRENVTVVLGSATPALESYHNARQERYRLAVLSRRIDSLPMPQMEVVNLCDEKDAAGAAQILSRQLIAATRNALDRGEQVIYFLNRRGYATQLQCLKCGFVAACDDCSVKFTYHREQERLVCHTCGAVRRAPTSCPTCADPGIRYKGLGTEKVEAVVRGVFPGARVLRMDADTMTRKNAYDKALSDFQAGAVDILVGTQMIAKGLHFPNVTLVGVVFADLSLYLPDFRAGERTFQLLVQVAGRAGRGDAPGRVVIQTYTPYHPALAAAVRLDYAGFFDEELELRQQFGFPPVTRLVLLRLRGRSEDRVKAALAEVVAQLQPHLPPAVELTPPLPAMIARQRGEYHYQVLLSGPRTGELSRLVKRHLTGLRLPKDLRLSIDVDPLSVL